MVAMLSRFVCTWKPQPAEHLGSSCLSPLKITLTLLAGPPATPLPCRRDKSNQLPRLLPSGQCFSYTLTHSCSRALAVALTNFIARPAVDILFNHGWPQSKCLS